MRAPTIILPGQRGEGVGRQYALPPLLARARELAAVVEGHPGLAGRPEREQHQVGVQQVRRVQRRVLRLELCEAHETTATVSPEKRDPEVGRGLCAPSVTSRKWPEEGAQGRRGPVSPAQQRSSSWPQRRSPGTTENLLRSATIFSPPSSWPTRPTSRSVSYGPSNGSSGLARLGAGAGLSSPSVDDAAAASEASCLALRAGQMRTSNCTGRRARRSGRQQAVVPESGSGRQPVATRSGWVRWGEGRAAGDDGRTRTPSSSTCSTVESYAKRSPLCLAFSYWLDRREAISL